MMIYNTDPIAAKIIGAIQEVICGINAGKYTNDYGMERIIKLSDVYIRHIRKYKERYNETRYGMP